MERKGLIVEQQESSDSDQWQSLCAHSCQNIQDSDNWEFDVCLLNVLPDWNAKESVLLLLQDPLHRHDRGYISLKVVRDNLWIVSDSQ